ncbi:MAG TPA: hypothetical protein VMP03_16810 [Methylomirabilota bacterium]|nr:hypothetical protein [Methylomirabilota bacterium]
MIEDIAPTDMQIHRLDFIERMALELGRLATGADLPVLAYLLDMVAEEAALTRRIAPVVAIPSGPNGQRIPRTRGGAS